MNIYLIRHGESTANEKKQYSGKLDVLLSDNGKQELKKISKELSHLNGLPVYTSTLIRTKQTTEILFPNSEIQDQLEFMKEIDFGNFEGKTYDELKSNPEYLQFLSNMMEYEPQNGEGYKAFSTRVIEGFSTHIKTLEEDSIYVTHGGVIRMIMSHLADTNIPFFEWAIHNGRGYQITIKNNKFITYKQI